MGIGGTTLPIFREVREKISTRTLHLYGHFAPSTFPHLVKVSIQTSPLVSKQTLMNIYLSPKKLRKKHFHMIPFPDGRRTGFRPHSRREVGVTAPTVVVLVVIHRIYRDGTTPRVYSPMSVASTNKISYKPKAREAISPLQSTNSLPVYGAHSPQIQRSCAYQRSCSDQPPRFIERSKSFVGRQRPLSPEMPRSA